MSKDFRGAPLLVRIRALGSTVSSPAGSGAKNRLKTDLDLGDSGLRYGLYSAGIKLILEKNEKQTYQSNVNSHTDSDDVQSSEWTARVFSHTWNLVLHILNILTVSNLQPRSLGEIFLLRWKFPSKDAWNEYSSRHTRTIITHFVFVRKQHTQATVKILDCQNEED